MAVDPKLIEKIRKLFRLGDAARNSSEGEVMNALEAAKRLMAENNISMAEVARETTKEGVNKNWNPARKVAAGQSGKKQHIAIFENTLFQAVGKLTGTQPIRFGTMMVFFGEENDVAIAEALYQALLGSLRACSRSVIGAGWTPSHRQYAEGFTDAIWSRACASAAPSAASDGTMALVLASKSTWLDAQLKLAFPNLKSLPSAKPKGKQDPFAYSAGHSDGKKVDLEHKHRLGS